MSDPAEAKEEKQAKALEDMIGEDDELQSFLNDFGE